VYQRGNALGNVAVLYPFHQNAIMSEPIVIDTETGEAKRQIWMVNAGCWLGSGFAVLAMCYIAFAPDSHFPHPVEIKERVCVFLYGFVTGGFLFYLPHLCCTRGRWRLDGEGVSFTPHRKTKTTTMAWRDVEAIYTKDHATFVFRIGKNKLPLALNLEPGERHAEIIAFLHEKLGSRFDVFASKPKPFSLRRWLKIASVIIPLGVGCGYFTFIFPCYHLPYEWLKWWVSAWAILAGTLFFSFAGVIAWRQYRRNWHTAKTQ
jgi:hypothetical protein